MPRRAAAGRDRRLPRSGAAIAAAVGGLGLGVLAEAAAYDWDRPVLWVPDLLVGWTFLLSGLVAWVRRGRRPAAVLLAAAGGTWFLGFLPAAVFLHRGPLVHLLVTYPGWRPRSRLDLIAVVTGYAAALVTPWWGNDLLAAATIAALLAVAGTGLLRAEAGDRRNRQVALWAVGWSAALVVGGAAVRRVLASEEAVLGTLLAYEAGLVALAVALTALLPRPSAAVLTDVVVELNEERTGTLRDRLAHLLGDPSLVVGYWSPETRTYLDERGRLVELPPRGADRVATPVGPDGAPFAVLVHDRAVPVPSLRSAVETAMRLAAANQTLRGEVQRQIAEVSDGRRRLVGVADRERRALAERLRRGPQPHLATVGAILRDLPGDDAAAPAEHLARARDHLERACQDIHDLALGLHPRELSEGGLPGALAALRARSPVPVRVEAAVGRLPEEVEAVLYFLCAEAVTNALKHARAGRIEIRVAAGPDRVRVAVRDDGVGGAEPSRGSGLQGLADRVAALGGRLQVTSPPGAGTCLAADLPVGGEGSSGGG